VGSCTSGQPGPNPASSAASTVALFWLSVKAAGTVITAERGAPPSRDAASARSVLSTSADSCGGVSSSPARANLRRASTRPISSLNSAAALSGSDSTRSRAWRPTYTTSGSGIQTADGVTSQPSLLLMITASPFSTTAIALFVVPRSMPMSMVPLSDKITPVLAFGRTERRR
jgi:hypothetical protein